MTSPTHRAEAHRPLSKSDVRNVFYGLMLAMFLSALNQTIVATALPTIGRQFGDFENLSWVIISYLLSSTVVAPLYGKLSDIHGRRTMMLLAIGLFVNAAKGISSLQVSRDLDIHAKTAFVLLHEFRCGLSESTAAVTLTGVVEIEIGCGRNRSMAR